MNKILISVIIGAVIFQIVRDADPWLNAPCGKFKIVSKKEFMGCISRGGKVFEDDPNANSLSAFSDSPSESITSSNKSSNSLIGHYFKDLK